MNMKMILNIFNIFDPSSRYFISLNWIRIIIILLFLPYQFWLIPSRLNFFFFIIIKFILNEFKNIINFSLINIITLIRIFLFIIFNNFIGLFPYIFTATTHIRLCLSLSINLWIRIILYGWINFYNSIFTHLTPLNTPYILIPFIIIIELIRLIIRPITLAIRLTTNIIAGHLLLSLIGSSRININYISIFIIIIITQLILFILEISVSLIQAYVFSILSLLYKKEI